MFTNFFAKWFSNSVHKRTIRRQKSTRPFLESLEDRLAPAVVNFLGVSNVWETPANWSSGVLPTDQDDVYMALAGQVSLVNATSAIAVKSLHLSLPITLNVQGSLYTDVLELSGGNLGGTGSVTVNERLDWNSGGMYASGTTNIGESAFMYVNSGMKSLWMRTINNSGTVHWLSDDSISASGGTFNNNAGSEFALLGSGGFAIAPGDPVTGLTFINDGVFAKRSSTWTATFSTELFTNNNLIRAEEGTLQFAGMAFNNPASGTVEVLSPAALSFQVSGNSTGPITVNQGAQLQFAPPNAFLVSSVAGDGMVSFTNGLTLVSGNYSVGTTNVQNTGRVQFQSSGTTTNALLRDSGEIGGAGELTVTGQMIWFSGKMDGNGTLRIAEDAVLLIDSLQQSSSRILGKRTIQNHGTTRWLAGDIEAVGDPFTFNNHGSFTIHGDDAFYGGLNSAFNNFGLLSKELDQITDAGSKGTTLFGPGLRLYNTGHLEIHFGTLQLIGGANFSTGDGGRVFLSSGTYLQLIDGVYALEAGSFFDASSQGVVTLIDGALDVQTPVTIPVVEMFEVSSIVGPEKLTISQKLFWSANSAMAGTGATEIGPNAILEFGPGQMTLYDRFLSNYGASVWSTGSPFQRITPEGQIEIYRNPAGTVENLQVAADTAWHELAFDFEEARMELAEVENGLNDQYEAAEDAEADVLQGLLWEAEDTYETELQDAQSQFDNSDQEVAADEAYWDAVAEAEGALDDAIETAAGGYRNAESTIYEQYASSLDTYATNGEYQSAITTALANFRNALRTAGKPGVGDISNFAQWVHQTLHSQIIGDPMAEVSSSLAGKSADTRAALATAYRRIYGFELASELSSQAVNYLYFGQASDPSQPPEPNRGNLLTRLGSWVSNAYNFVANLTPDDVWDGIISAYESVNVAFHNISEDFAQRMRENSGSFFGAFRDMVADQGVVIGNAFTFGFIPELNASAEQIVAERGGIYKALQIASVFGREAILTYATAGASQIYIGLGTRFAGRLAGGLGMSQAAQARFICTLTTASRFTQPAIAYNQLDHLTFSMDRAGALISAGDYEGAARLLGQAAGAMPLTISSVRETIRFARAVGSLNPQRMQEYLAACFAAGTPILGEHGPRPIEDYKAGDKVWARDENDPEGPLELREIEECFDRTGRIFHLHVGGQVIRTTDEHPFWVDGKGWVKTIELEAGDLLIGRDGDCVEVEEVFDTGQYETVYNFRVAEHHTYFVGGDEWGFTVWAHNSPCVIRRYDARFNSQPPVLNKLGQSIPIYGAPQVTNGFNGLAHAQAIMNQVQALAPNAPAGSYFVLNRSWSTALGRHYTTTRLRPDIIYAEHLGGGRFRIHAYEVASPGQSHQQLLNQLNQAWSGLFNYNSVLKGVFRVI